MQDWQHMAPIVASAQNASIEYVWVAAHVKNAEHVICWEGITKKKKFCEIKPSPKGQFVTGAKELEIHCPCEQIFRKLKIIKFT